MSPPPGGLPDWAAVVINWNGAADLPTCLTALAEQVWPPVEVVVVDNASTDDSLAVLGAWPMARLLALPRNLGFAGGANAGIAATGAPLVATLNPDVALRPSWGRVLCAAFAAEPRLGAAGGKLLYQDGVTLQHAGGRIERPSLVAENIGRGEREGGQYDAPAEVDFLTGGALLLRRAALDEVGAFDEDFYPAYYEDVDLCARLRAGGWGVRYLPGATGIHRESGSVDARGAAYYRMIHGGRLRFASKHLPLRELLGRYLPREAARLAAALQHLSGPGAADRAGLSAFPDALLAAPTNGSAVRGAAGEPATAPVSPGHGSLADPGAGLAGEGPPVDLRPLLERLAEVRRRWLIEERPFTSARPRLGRLIVWLRTRLNDAGPRWHVGQILGQQVEYNAAVARALEGTAAEAQAARLADQAAGAILAERIEALLGQQAALAERLIALEQRLAALEADSTTRTTIPSDRQG